MKLRAIYIIFARAVVCWLHIQSNHRIGKNRRAENPPALLYFALVKEVSVQSCFTSIWQRKCRGSSALLRFGKGSVCAVLLYFTLAKEVLVRFCFTSIWQRKFWCGSALLHFGKGSFGAVLHYFTLVKEVFVQLGQGGILSLSPKVTSKPHFVQLYSPLPGFSPV